MVIRATKPPKSTGHVFLIINQYQPLCQYMSHCQSVLNIMANGDRTEIPGQHGPSILPRHQARPGNRTKTVKFEFLTQNGLVCLNLIFSTATSTRETTGSRLECCFVSSHLHAVDANQQGWYLWRIMEGNLYIAGPCWT